MAEILPIRRKTLFIDQSIILWRSDLSKVYPSPYVEKKKWLALIKAIVSLLLENLTFGVIIGVVTSFATIDVPQYSIPAAHETERSI